MIEKKLWVRPTVVSKPSAISPEKQVRLSQLHHEGLEVTVIAERLGLHTNTVHRWLYRMGVKKIGACLACGGKRKVRARCYCTEHGPEREV